MLVMTATLSRENRPNREVNGDEDSTALLVRTRLKNVYVEDLSRVPMRVTGKRSPNNSASCLGKCSF